MDEDPASSVDARSVKKQVKGKTIDRQVVEVLIISVDIGFEKFLEVYERPLFGYAQRLAQNLPTAAAFIEAKDIYQEAMLDIYEGLKAHEREVQWFLELQRAWLYRLTYTAFLKIVRAYKNVQLSSIDEFQEEYDDMLEDSDPGPEMIQQRKEFLEEVQKGLATLTEKYRKPLELCCFKFMTYEDIARQLNISEDSARIHIYRGRLKLRAYLESRGILDRRRSKDGK